MKNKRILFTAPSVAELLDCEMPVAAPGEAVVRLERSTISAGTERANLVGNPNVSPKFGPITTFPRASGYSSAGVVVEVGEGVEGLAVGDRVACSWSSHTKYCALKSKNVHKLPDSVGYDSAALIHISTFPMAAIRKCGLEFGESVVIMGLGVLGIVGVKLARAAGAVPIVAVDPVAEKREYALKLGADYAFDPFAPDFAERVKEVTEGGAHVALEITGNGAGLDGALDCMRPFGHVGLLGCTRSSDFTIDYYRKVHGPGITLIGAHTMARPQFESAHGWWTEADDAVAVIKSVAHGHLELASLVEEVHSPAEAPEVYKRLAGSSVFPIVQFDWSLIEE